MAAVMSNTAAAARKRTGAPVAKRDDNRNTRVTGYERVT